MWDKLNRMILSKSMLNFVMRIISEEKIPSLFDRKPDLLPEIISRLIKLLNPSTFQRIPRDSSTKGPDGWMLNINSQYSSILPSGESLLEMTTQKKNIWNKADEDFEKHDGDKIPLSRMKELSFVFITSSKFNKCEQWRNEKLKTNRWKDIRVIDAAVLADWLEGFPRIALSLLRGGGSVGFNDLRYPDEHWKSMNKRAKQFELSPELFIFKERYNVVKAVREYLHGNSYSGQALCIKVNSSSEFEDFLSALLTESNAAYYLDESNKHPLTESITPLNPIDEARNSSKSDNLNQSILDRSIILKTKSAWEDVLPCLSIPHIFIPSRELDISDPESNLIQDTLDSGHLVVYWTKAQNTSGLTLIQTPRETLRNWLKNLNFHPSSINRLLHFSDSQLWPVISMINNEIPHPILGNDNWIKRNWESLMFACLLGEWVVFDDPDDSKQIGDRTLIKELVYPKRIEDWENIVENTLYESMDILERRRTVTLKGREEENINVPHNSSVWSFVHRSSGFHILGKRLSRKVRVHFSECVKKIFEQISPAFKYESGKTYGNPQGRFSDNVILGVLQTLCYFQHFPHLFHENDKEDLHTVCDYILETLLMKNNWNDLASHKHLLPLAAEMSPERFLDKLEISIKSTPDPFYSMFSQNDNFGSIGLLRALEVLAWDKKSFPRVMRILLLLSTRIPSAGGGNKFSFGVLKRILNPFDPQHTLESKKWREVIFKLRDKDEFELIVWRLTCSILETIHAPTHSLPPNLIPYCAEWIPYTWKNEIDRIQLGELRQFYFELLLYGLDGNLHRMRDVTYLIRWMPGDIFEKVVTIIGDTNELKEKGSLFDIWRKLVSEQSFLIDSDPDGENELTKRFKSLAEIYESKLCYLDKVFSENWRDVFFLFTDTLFVSLLEMSSKYVSDDELQKSRDETTGEFYRIGGIVNIIKLALLITQPFAFGRTVGRLKEITQKDARYIAEISFSEITEFIETYMPYITQPPDRSRVVQSFKEFYPCFIETYFLHNKKWEWIKQLKINNWNESLRLQFLLALPEKVETWEYIARNFTQEEERYWELFELPNSIKKLEELQMIVEKLGGIKRFVSAANALWIGLSRYKGRYGHLFISTENNPIFEDFKNSSLFREICIAIYLTLNALVNNESTEQRSFSLGYAHELINCLYNSELLTEEEYKWLEWTYILPYTLEKDIKPRFSEIQMCKDSSYFCEVINEVYKLRRISVESDHQPELIKQRDTSLHNLLRRWSILPGVQEHGYDVEEILKWLNSVMKDKIMEDKTVSDFTEYVSDTLGKVISKYPECIWSDKRIASFMEDHKQSDIIIDAFVAGISNKYQFSISFEEHADSMREMGMPKIAIRMSRSDRASQKVNNDLVNLKDEAYRTLDDY